MNPNELTEGLREIYGDILESVILYGSAADGEFHKGHSDYNTIIILKDVSVGTLARGSKIIKKWSKDKNPIPLFFTPSDIGEAADVFPIEFSDIKERHKALYGRDPFQEIKIDIKNLRHQCEHELRSKLLALESRAAFLADKPKELIRLILDSSSSIFAIFGGVLRLALFKPAPAKKEMLKQIASLTGIDTAISNEIVDVREGKCSWKKDSALEKFEQYLTSIRGIVKYTDKF